MGYRWQTLRNGGVEVDNWKRQGEVWFPVFPSPVLIPVLSIALMALWRTENYDPSAQGWPEARAGIVHNNSRWLWNLATSSHASFHQSCLCGPHPLNLGRLVTTPAKYTGEYVIFKITWFFMIRSLKSRPLLTGSQEGLLLRGKLLWKVSDARLPCCKEAQFTPGGYMQVHPSTVLMEHNLWVIMSHALGMYIKDLPSASRTQPSDIRHWVTSRYWGAEVGHPFGVLSESPGYTKVVVVYVSKVGVVCRQR